LGQGAGAGRAAPLILPADKGERGMTITETFLLALALVMGLPWLVWRLLRTDNWAPLVVVQIVAGVLLGPGVLGVALPQVHDVLFTPDVIAALNGIAWWAVMIFVWLAGIELDLHHKKRCHVFSYWIAIIEKHF